MRDPLCQCGHLASTHADPSSGDTRCLAVETREDLIDVFDDGRDTAYGTARACASPRPVRTPAQLFIGSGEDRNRIWR